jgi:hypothetical protein
MAVRGDGVTDLRPSVSKLRWERGVLVGDFEAALEVVWPQLTFVSLDRARELREWVTGEQDPPDA